MSFTPPMGLGFTPSNEPGRFGSPPLPVPVHRRTRVVRRWLAALLTR